MGLKNASVQFQHMMDDILSSVKDVANCYIDDISVGTKVVEGEDLFAKHDEDLRKVLDLLNHFISIVDIKKCA